MFVVRPLILGGLLTALGGALLASAPPEVKKEADPVSYYRDVRPLFQQHCTGCHQPAKPQGGYVMTGHADLLKKGERDQPGVVPGRPDQSMVLEQITPRAGQKPKMPKGKDPLPERDVLLIKRWITEGARDDTPPSARDTIDAGHPPAYVLPPVLSSLDFSPDGKLLAVSGYHEVLLHRADGSGLVGRLIGLSERVQSLAFSPDGRWLAVAGGSPGRFGEIQVWDVARKKLRLSVSVTFDTLYGVSWSPDGERIAFGCADNTLRAIEASTGKQVLFQGAHNDWVLGTVFDKYSAHVVSVGRDRTMKLTELATQRFIDNVTSITPGALKGGLAAVARRPQPDYLFASALAGLTAAPGHSPLLAATSAIGHLRDDEMLAGGADGVPRLYRMYRVQKRVIGDDFNKLADYPALPGRIYSLAFTRDGRLFAAGSSLDGQGHVQVYETAGGKVVSRLEGAPGAVYAVAFHPNGKSLASAGFDGVVRLSDPATGKVLKEFQAVPAAFLTQGQGP